MSTIIVSPYFSVLLYMIISPSVCKAPLNPSKCIAFLSEEEIVVISESEITRQPELSEDLAFSSCLAE
jgi:hypothetical protein